MARKTNSKKSTPVNTPTKQKKKVAEKKPSTIIPKERVTKAVDELIKYTSKSQESDKEEEKNGKKQLLEDDEAELKKDLQLIVVNNKSFTGTSKSFKLKLLNIKHSLYKPWKEASLTAVKDFKTLLILKDSDIKKVSEDDLFDKLDSEGIKIDEIICGKDLKTVYKAYEARSAFISQFSLILADDSIVTSLPKLMGVKAYNKVETTPVAIRTQANKEFSLTTLTNNIKKVYLNQLPIKMPRGTTLNVHLGNLEWLKPEEFVDNILSVSEQLIKGFPIRSVFIKTNKSPVLPLYYNQDVLDELVAKKEKTQEKTEDDMVTIDGVQVHLSTFNKGLMEIANPTELGAIFSRQVNSAKKRTSDELEKKSSESETVKKAKN
ncbi:Cic1p [Saccharomyces eubayanus]|uniref:Cic1p n=1 Tax=Saccharomyces eubayanus TaxID=1080349 RepID=UPI0006C7250B|nr:CIC1-like protein [Saccharomyces eubayanus]KOG99117.1 CIC1-like protein [Saccharomyces eubayanus]